MNFIDVLKILFAEISSNPQTPEYHDINNHHRQNEERYSQEKQIIIKRESKAEISIEISAVPVPPARLLDRFYKFIEKESDVQTCWIPSEMLLQD